jgi:hypothetical protein
LGVLALGFSWILLFHAAGVAPLGTSFAALAWVHVVALGWITLVALSVLLHVIPAFLDVPWRSAGIARGATLVFAAGAAALVAGFLSTNFAVLQSGASIALVSIVIYAAAACRPFLDAIREGGTARAVARAFATTLILLVITAVLGALAVWMLSGMLPWSLLDVLPRSHALLGIVGWLSLLVIGVSARTMGPITGQRSKRVWAHIVSSSALLAGAVVAAIAILIKHYPATLVGVALILLGIIVYAFDLFTVLWRASMVHRPPQVLMGCAALSAVVAALLLAGTLLGQPWGFAAVYLALLGWIGSAVLAHLHHIGVRVLLTTVRGEHDETPPHLVLRAPLTWTTTVAYELAVILGALGLIPSQSAPLRWAAVCGFVSFVTLAWNLGAAYRKARRMPALPQPIAIW